MRARDARIRASGTFTRRDALQAIGVGAGALLAGRRFGPAGAQDDAVTLRYQNHWSKETDAHYEGMNWLYETFHQQYPEIRIENILNPDSVESDKKIRADCAAGDCPDIIHDAAADMWSAGYLLDLTPHVADDPAWQAIFMPGPLEFISTDGQLWGLSGEVSPMPTIWNTRILDEAGVGAVPATWDELLAACEQITAAGYTPTSWGVGGVHQWHNIVVGQAGGREALAAQQFDAPPVVDAFARLKLFVDNQWIPDNELELTWQQSVALFVAEQTAFYLNGAWTIGNEITGQGAAPDLKDHVAFAPYPAVGENGPTVEIKQTTTIGLARALEEDPAKLEAAITFFKYWFSEEGARQWILLTRSPMGVAVDLSTLEGVDPLLLAFLGVPDQAATAYSLPGTQAMQERGWDDCWSGLQTLMTGDDVDAAVAALQEEMSKYTSA